MNRERLAYVYRLLVKAAVQADDRPVPEWRFDGQEIRTARDIAAAMGIPAVEAKERLAQKDVYAGSGAGTQTVGIGTRTHHAGICKRANALAYGYRRRRRRKGDRKK